jgi:hypothetical protein
MPLEKTSNLQQMNLLFSGRPPLQLPGEKQRDLTAALADLLLNAAAAACSEHCAEHEREDKDASQADC